MVNLFKRNYIWSVALYKVGLDYNFSDQLPDPIKLLDPKTIRKSKDHIHTYADPFLFVYKQELYLFFEVQSVSKNGVIHAMKTKDFDTYEYLGSVLEADNHFSYPFVTEINSTIYMIPETASVNEVALYKFTTFPYQPVKVKTLLTGGYADSSLFKHQGTWYLFTTCERGFEIFFTSDPENIPLTPHPKNPITNDLRFFRCGGAPVSFGGHLFRFAQDCSSDYGKNITILKINELSETDYSEEIYMSDYFSRNKTWNAEGGHHFSTVDLNGNKLIAVDGKQYDYFINKIMSPIFAKF